MAKILGVHFIAPKGSKWVEYPVTLTSAGGGAITLNPTSASALKAFWRQIGENIEISFSFRNGSGGAATGAAGQVIIPYPPGITPNVNVQAPPVSGLRADGYGQAGSTNSVEATFYAFTNGIRISPHNSVTYTTVADIAANFYCTGTISIPVNEFTLN